MHFASVTVHKPSLRLGRRHSLGVKQQEGEFSKLCVTKVIYHIESIEANEMAC